MLSFVLFACTLIAHGQYLNVCDPGIGQVSIETFLLTNAPHDPINHLVFLDEFGESDLNNGNKGRDVSDYVPSSNFEFANSYLQFPNQDDDEEAIKQTRIGANCYAVVAPSYIKSGLFPNDQDFDQWTPGFDEPGAIPDRYNSFTGAVLALHSTGGNKVIYERQVTMPLSGGFYFSSSAITLSGNLSLKLVILDAQTQQVLAGMSYISIYEPLNDEAWGSAHYNFNLDIDCNPRDVIVRIETNVYNNDPVRLYLDNIQLLHTVPSLSCSGVNEGCLENISNFLELNDAVTEEAPMGYELVWRTRPELSWGYTIESEFIPPNSMLWAFYYNEDEDCYNTEYSTSKIVTDIVASCNFPVLVNDINQTPMKTPVGGNLLINDKMYSELVRLPMPLSANVDIGETTFIQQQVQELEDYDYNLLFDLKKVFLMDELGNETWYEIGEDLLTNDVFISDNSIIKAGVFTAGKNGHYQFIPEDDFVGSFKLKYIAKYKYGNDSDTAQLSIEVMPTMDGSPYYYPHPDWLLASAQQKINASVLDNDIKIGINEVEISSFVYMGNIYPVNNIMELPAYDVEGNLVSQAFSFVLNEDGSYDFQSLNDYVGDIQDITYSIVANSQIFEGEMAFKVVPRSVRPVFYAKDDVHVGFPQLFQGNVFNNDYEQLNDYYIYISTSAIMNFTGTSQDFLYYMNPPQVIEGVGVFEMDEEGNYSFEPETGFYGTVSIYYYPYADMQGATSNQIASLYITVLEEQNPLPLGLMSFEVREELYGAKLKWTHSQTQSIEFFVVEKSYNAANWEVIGEIYSNGQNNVNEFQFWDSNLSKGQQYYRLKIVSKEGDFNYSEVRTLIIEDSSSLGIEFYPVPVHHVLNIKGLLSVESIRIMDMTGKIVFEDNNVEGTSVINVSEWREGIYLIKMRTNEGQVIFKKINKI